MTRQTSERSEPALEQYRTAHAGHVIATYPHWLLCLTCYLQQRPAFFRR